MDLIPGKGIEIKKVDGDTVIRNTIENTDQLKEGGNLFFTKDRVLEILKGILKAGDGVSVEEKDGAFTVNNTKEDKTYSFNGDEAIKVERIDDNFILRIDMAALRLNKEQVSGLVEYNTDTFNKDFLSKTTSDLPEGENLYYTKERAISDTEEIANKKVDKVLDELFEYVDGQDEKANEKIVDFIANSLKSTKSIKLSFNKKTKKITAVLDKKELAHEHPQYLLSDGSRELTGDWNAGDYQITARKIVSTLTTRQGSPLEVESMQMVKNLNADMLDNFHASDFAGRFHKHVMADITDYVPPVVYTDEQAQDAAASLIQNGTGITWAYNDAANTLTPTVTITQYTDEMAQDAVGNAVGNGLDYNDTTGAIFVDDSELDHGLLSGLGDDDHTQYLLLAGRSGGQIEIGGTSSLEGLTLRSNTSFDGFVDLGDVASDPKKFIRFDETTGFTGFGIIPTTAQVEIMSNTRDDMSVFRIKDNDGNKIFDNQIISRFVYAQLGDIDNANNNTLITVDDSGATITLNADTQVQIITGANTATFSNTGLGFSAQTDINLNNGALTASAAVLTEFLQNDLITNGGFTGGTTGWSLGAGWAYGTNNVTKNADGNGTLTPSTPLTISAGSPYKLEFVISSITVGSVTVTLGGTTVGTYTAAGSYVEYVIASGTGNLIFNPTHTSRFTVDTIALHILQPHLQASGTYIPLRVQKISSHPYSDEYMFNLSHIINKATSGNDTTFLINNVDTASPGSSFFEDFRLNGVSQWKMSATGLITMMNAISTVSNGVPVEYAKSDLTAQSAAIAATTLYAVPSTGAGMYRVSWVASITTAASTSSVLGGTNGFQLKYTDPTDSVVKTTAAPVTTSAANTTGTSISGVLVAYCKASTNLQYLFDYTSVGGTAMQYDLDIKVEAL